LFIDAAEKSIGNARPYINLTEMAVRERRCGDALPYLRRADHLFPGFPRVQVAWSWALECLGRRDEALQRLMAARNMQPTADVYEQIGLLYGEMGRVEESGEALKAAVALEPGSATAHEALALWHESLGDLRNAELEYEKSLALNPHNPNLQTALTRVRSGQALPSSE
jgi:tetratricopeptide (TPR) repeat protein